MANVLVNEDYLFDIANAIREKGQEGSFKPSEMADAILRIVSENENNQMKMIKIYTSSKILFDEDIQKITDNVTSKITWEKKEEDNNVN